MEDKYVTVVSPNDVLFGRGSGPNDHEGNIKFRDLVSQRKSEYMATNHRQTKAKIAKAIVDTVFNNNGRFLKKLENAELLKLGFQTGMDVYAVVDDDTVMEKAKQALRQNRDKNVSSGSSTATPPPDEISRNYNYRDGLNSMLPPKPPGAAGTSAYENSLDFPEPIPLHAANIQPVPAFSNAQPVYTDAEGYSTYTTTLDDPEDQSLFSRPNDVIGGSYRQGGSRRGSLLGGRKDAGGRRDSLQMGEVWRRDSMMGMKGESMQMSELMESFKAMSTQGGLDSSADTIGTIDNGYGGNNQMSGISNMSVISMSSNISLFKTNSTEHDSGRSNESPDRGEAADSMMLSSYRGNANDEIWDSKQLPPSGNEGKFQRPSENRRESLIPADMWNSRNVNALLQAPIDGSSANMGVSSSLGMGLLPDLSTSAMNPRPVSQLQSDSMNYLGSSSMSVLRAATADQDSTRILPPERK